MKMLWAAALAAGIGLAGSAQAAITQLTFTGTGRVTYAQDGFFAGFPIDAPDVGDLVTVTGTINLGDGSRPDLAPILPDDFTGVIDLSQTALFDGYQSVTFNFAGGGMSGDTDFLAELNGAQIRLVGGHLHSFDFSFDYDPDVSSFTASTFARDFGSARWGGVWDYDQPDSMVPEPATWAMMLLGFGALGGALRRRAGRRVAA